MELQLWNSLYSETSKYEGPDLIMTGNFKVKLEVTLRDQTMKFLTVPKADTVL